MAGWLLKQLFKFKQILMPNQNERLVKYPKVLMKKYQNFLGEQKLIFIFELQMEHNASIYSRVHFERLWQNNVTDISFSSLGIAIFHHTWLHIVWIHITENTIRKTSWFIWALPIFASFHGAWQIQTWFLSCEWQIDEVKYCIAFQGHPRSFEMTHFMAKWSSIIYRL